MAKQNTPLVDLVKAKRKATSTSGLLGINTLVNAAVTAATGALSSAANAIVSANVASNNANTANNNLFAGFSNITTLVNIVFNVANIALASAANAAFTANIASNTANTNVIGLLPLANLKIVVAASTDFNDFKSRVANITL